MKISGGTTIDRYRTLGLLVCALLVLLCIPASAQKLTRITNTDAGSGDNGVRDRVSMSDDGTRIVFYSDAPDLGLSGNYLYNTTTQNFQRIGGANPELSGDGVLVVIEYGGIPPNIGLVDVATSAFTPITTYPSLDRASFHPSISGDGKKVVFSSSEDLLQEGRPVGVAEIWTYDRATSEFVRLTDTPKTTDSQRNNIQPAINADGTKIAFKSDADHLGQGARLRQFEKWLYDTTTSSFLRLSTTSESDRMLGLPSWPPSISADGTKVVFESESDFLGEGIPKGQVEIWLFDRTTSPALTRITHASASDRVSGHPVISGDGTMIAFYSNSDFLSPGAPLDNWTLWRYDLGKGKLERLVRCPQFQREIRNPAISYDGRRVAFSTEADLQVEFIPEGHFEVWMWEDTSPSGDLWVLF